MISISTWEYCSFLRDLKTSKHLFALANFCLICSLTLWVAHSKERRLHCSILQIWSYCVLLFFFLRTSSLHLLGLKMFWLLLSKGGRSHLLQNNRLTFHWTNRVWNVIVDAQELCSVKASISKRGQLFCFYFYWSSFHKSVKFHYRKIRVMCCGRSRHEKSI